MHADVHDAAAVDAAVAGVDAVCHQAAKVGLGIDFADVTDYVSTNGGGTAVLLEALWRRSFRGRLVLASSMVVYGEGLARCPVHGAVRPGPRRDVRLDAGQFEPECPVTGCRAELGWEPVDEDRPVDPRNVYAATKVHQEQLCSSWSRESGGSVVALRYHNVYGPRMPRDTPYAGVAAIFRSALAAGRAPQVFEDGRQTRDFVHVDDVARANLLALRAPDHASGAYNVASGTPHTVGEMADALADSFGPDAPRPIVTGGWRPGDVRHIVASPASRRGAARVRGRDLLRRRRRRVRDRAHERARADVSGARHPPLARTAGAAVAFVAATTASVVLSTAIATGRPILGARWTLLWQLTVWCAIWIVGVVAAWQLPRRVAIPAILVAATLVRIAALAGPPITSDDLYRYSWDGRVQAAGIDPYRYPPAAPQLAGLREDWLWPSADGCAAIRRPTGCTLINRSSQPTIYPPAAEAWFAGIYRLAGIDAGYKPWQVAGLAVDLATVGLLLAALRRWRRDERWTALYALCPAPVLELVNNGHVDGVAIALMLAALLVARPPPWPSRLLRSEVGRDIAVGLLIGAAALVKLYPALLLVALVAAPGANAWRRAARAAAAAGGLIVIAYAPHVAAVGGKVVGYLPGYLDEEHYASGGRFLLLGLLGLHGKVAAAAALGVFAGAIVAITLRRPGTLTAAVVVFGVLLLVTSPVQPWYAVSVVALAALARRPWWAAVVFASYPYFLAVILGSSHAVGIGQTSYGVAAIVIATGELIAARCVGARRPGDPSQTASGQRAARRWLTTTT